jgi:urease subunit beta
MKPGEIICPQAFVTLNEGLESRELKATNKGSRPIQVGSHFHFFEVNRCIEFDRPQAYGFRPDLPSGTAIRFEPGEEKIVRLVRIAGRRVVRGLNHLTDAQINDTTSGAALVSAQRAGFVAQGEKQ